MFGITCKRHADMLIKSTDLADSPLLLQLRYGLLLHTQDDDVFPSDSNLNKERQVNKYT